MTDMTTRTRHDALELETMLLTRYLHPNRRFASERTRYLERSAYTLLSRVAAQGPMSIGELSDALGLDVSTLNRQTAAMTKAGDLARIPDPEGGMARKFQATATGKQHLEADRHANAEGLSRVVADWSPEDVDTFVALLRRFNNDLENLDGRPWPRK
ncbi:MarR family winged helix-turn-helix transcriptional regulator [Rhodococcus sp. NCIMB 12038]|uniref:MarR family winged helix-turn-helix transcriptional regulator n=1 Tax=Rhodococcus sp. NCIMB 12038 TaxID=933800 RepID=UPI000B581A9B|nr:MarR family transcriptional regulator [Rhodococcus sp. NCIMB 12038]OUS95310.1 MarR family transcriptional regulator [Rhodococcus sp. NCIMB 12038]